MPKKGQQCVVRCDLSGEEWTANYDALRRRVNKTWRGQTTTYYWDDLRLAAEVRDGNPARIYVYAHDRALAPFLFLEYADLEAEPDSGKRYYVFANQISVPIRVEDDAGKLCWSAQIDPYGRAHVSKDSTIDMPLRFPGHYYDPESGLHYNRFRYYSPEIGRYLQSDPLGLEGGINLYAYPHRPLTIVDIDGRGPGKPKVGPKAEASPGKGQGCSSQPSAPRLPTPEEEEQMRKDLVLHTKARAKELDDKKAPGKGPVQTGIIDPRFPDEIHFGQNKNGELPKDLHPLLQDRLDAHNKDVKEGKVTLGEKEKTAFPGDHSEIAAADKALKAREDKMGMPRGSANEDDLDELLAHNSNSQKVDRGPNPNKGQEGQPSRIKGPAGSECPPRFDHCQGITGPRDSGQGMTMIGQDGKRTDR